MRKYYYWIYIGIWMGLSACTDGLTGDWTSTEEDEGLCYFKVEYQVAEEISIGGQEKTTRSAPTDTDETKVTNLWVFQFDGLDDSSVLLTKPRYVEASADGEVVIGAIPSLVPHRLLFVANTNLSSINWEVTKGITTYKELVRKSGNWYKESETYGQENKNLLMCGKLDGAITLNSKLKPILQHAVAKIKLELKVKPGMPYKVNTVRLCNVPAQIYWFEPLLPQNENDLFPKLLESTYWTTSSETLLPEGENSQTYVWYMPCNRRGISSSASPLDKNRHALGGATYIEIGVTDTGGGDVIGRTYRVYPGGNLINDHNLKSNYTYNLNLTLTEGTPDDSRVEISRNIVFTETSNSYLLNPPPAGSNPVKFSIPVVDRVNQFYGNPNYASINNETGFSGYNNVSQGWECRIIWCDNNKLFEPGNYHTASSKTLAITGYQGNGTQKHMEVTLPPLTPEQYGNVLVGIYDRNADGSIGACRWSWHLWVTDYNPNVDISIHPSQFVYNVPNGEVVRMPIFLFGYRATANGEDSNVSPGTGYTRTYETLEDLNKTSPYRKSYIMDRDLGACMAAGSTYETQGLVYQYGRKDPFIILPEYYDGEGKKYDTYSNQVLPTTGNNIIKMKKIASGNALPTMSDLHKDPTSVYNGSYDYVGVRGGGTAPLEKLNELYFTWHDTQLAYAGKTAGQTIDPWNQFRKSLFDPCPQGWQVLSRDMGGEYNAMSLAHEFGSRNYAVPSNPGEQNSRGLYAYGVRGTGMYYWPSVIKEKGQALANTPVEGVIYFPRSYTLDENGKLQNINEYPDNSSSFWLATMGEVQGVGAAFAHSYTTPYFNNWGYLRGNYKSKALLVRCVKSPQTPPK